MIDTFALKNVWRPVYFSKCDICNKNKIIFLGMMVSLPMIYLVIWLLGFCGCGHGGVSTWLLFIRLSKAFLPDIVVVAFIGTCQFITTNIARTFLKTGGIELSTFISHNTEIYMMVENWVWKCVGWCDFAATTATLVEPRGAVSLLC